jgi:hypothetical protein
MTMCGLLVNYPPHSLYVRYSRTQEARRSLSKASSRGKGAPALDQTSHLLLVLPDMILDLFVELPAVDAQMRMGNVCSMALMKMFQHSTSAGCGVLQHNVV